MQKEILKEVGLSEREISVYVSLIEIGSTTTGPLVKKSGVQNAKIYETLEKLIKKGLVTFIIKGKTKYFQASNPKSLLDILEDRKFQVEKEVNELILLRNKNEPEQESRIYNGIKSIKTAFFEMYDYIGECSEYCVFPIGEQLGSEELKLFWAQVLRKQKEMKIKIKTLPNKKYRSIFDDHYKKHKFVNVKYTNQRFPTGIFIFKDHILTVVWSEKPTAFLIRSKNNYLSWQTFFNEQWEKATQ